MEIKRKAKILLGFFLMGIVLSISVRIVNAGACNHGGECPTYTIYRKPIGCIQTVSHPCYVGGQLTTCQTYVYKIRIYERCIQCGDAKIGITCGPTIHHYMH